MMYNMLHTKNVVTIAASGLQLADNMNGKIFIHWNVLYPSTFLLVGDNRQNHDSDEKVT